MDTRDEVDEAPSTQHPALRTDDQEVLVPYTIALLCFCLAAGLLLAVSIVPLKWLPGQFPLLLVLCYVFPLAAIFSRRYQATLSGLAAREYGTRALLGTTLVFVLLLIGLPLLEWTRLHPGAGWKNLDFGLPVIISLIAGTLAWLRATGIFDQWNALHMQPWEDGASDLPVRTKGFSEESGGRVNRTRQIAAMWRDFAAWGIVLSLAFFATFAFDLGGRHPSPVAAALLFAGYALTGPLVIGRSALLRLGAEWRLDRLTIAGNVGSSWLPTTVMLTVGAAALIALIVVARLLDLVHIVLAWAWNAFLGPILLALLYFLSNRLMGTSRHQFDGAMKSMGNLGQAPRPSLAAHPSHNAFSWTPFLIAGAAIATALLLRAYWEYRKHREPGQPWWRIFPAMLAELRRLLRALTQPARALAGQVVLRATVAAGGAEARRRRGRRRPGDLGPRALISYLYEQVLAAAARWGHPRRRGQTPGEYAAELGERLGSDREALDDLTTAFLEARYSPHEIRREMADRAQASWHALRQTIKGALRGASR